MVTLKDISNKTGFSLSVVSRALNAQPDQKVAAETKAIIEAAVKQLNYRRNHTASFLTKGRSAAIGVFLPEYGYSLIADFVIGMSKAADKRGFSYNIFFGLNESDYSAFIESTHESRNSGIISYMPESAISRDFLFDAIRKYCTQGGKALLLNSAGFPELGINSVNIDNQEGGRIAAEYLWGQKCEQYLCVYTASWQCKQRAESFCEFLGKYGIIAEMKLCIEQKKPELNVNEFVKKHKLKKMGIFAVSDYLAMDIMLNMHREGLGNEIGKRVKIIGYDDLPGSERTLPPLTTIHQSFKDLGMTGMNKLLNMVIDNANETPALLTPWLVVRESA